MTRRRRWRAVGRLLKRVPGAIPIVRMARTLASPLGRGGLRAQRSGARLFQPATVTRADRHPALFDAVARHLGDHETPRILSFGCSTGEEAFALARLLPRAAIVAIDANSACIARARRRAERLGLSRIAFLCADSSDAVAPETFDALLCLSVLRHGDLEASRPDRCTALLPFARFADAVDALDRRLRPGGMLVLWGCHFRFTDTATAGRYRHLPTPEVKPQPGPFYGPDDRRLPDADYAAFVFVKAD